MRLTQISQITQTFSISLMKHSQARADNADDCERRHKWSLYYMSSEGDAPLARLYGRCTSAVILVGCVK